MSPQIGRPKADNPKDIRYSVRLDADTESRLQAYCEKVNITKGEAIRRGIELLLGQKK
ncbi:CopG family transcriptional regulator [Selenomonas sp. oral taxon 126]|uniref:CopG family transcriptional regulator n=1 Tax=Selenomonas sp. oral taxon 126 TaxID=712528 RepID=UPI0008078103|nr:CopG family transcriptional regulator [Selenomonas sp. oral taxon 126]ANR70111.1 CopG family transcriptional regulator [Selenomonas sp. oral taxon 126]